MRALLAFALLLVGLPALADPYQRLYQAAGWPDQRAHFSDALDAAQKRYQDKLPPALYQTLVDNSNRRFAPAEVDQRALNGLRENLPDSASPLNFFESPLGRKVVAAEVLATRRDQLLQHSNGLPRQTASEPRRALVKRLAQVLPAREAGAEVSLALAGVAADSLSQMLPGLPGLLGGGQTGQLLEGQRQRLVQQIGADLENTLLYVYRDLSDAELTQYVNFAESPAGRSYYQAALAALKAGLAVDQAVAPLIAAGPGTQAPARRSGNRNSAAAAPRFRSPGDGAPLPATVSAARRISPAAPSGHGASPPSRRTRPAPPGGSGHAEVPARCAAPSGSARRPRRSAGCVAATDRARGGSRGTADRWSSPRSAAGSSRRRGSAGGS